MEEGITFREFVTKSDGTVLAVFDRQHVLYEYDENGNSRPITKAIYTKEALETMNRNLKANGVAAPESDQALARWPK